jgi:hypothetical protein
VAGSEALFNRGVERMEVGDFAKGCPALVESYGIDPRPGTLFTLAECEAKWGHIATAYALYGDYLKLLETLPPDKKARQVQAGRDKDSRAQRAVLGPQVPELTIVLGPGVPRGAVVKCDQMKLADSSLGVALPVDPGRRVVTLEVPGRPLVEQRVRVLPGEKKQVVLQLAEVAEGARGEPTAVTETKDQRKLDPKILIGGGVVGLVGIILGAGFAVGSNMKAAQSHNLEAAGVKCPPPDVLCKGQFDSLQQSKVTFAGMSMWSFIGAGAALVGTGTYAVVKLAPKASQAPQAQVTVGMDRVGVALKLPW